MVEKENLSTLGESWGATKIEMRRKMEGRDLREREGDESLSLKDSGAMKRERRMGMACAGKEALRRGGGRMGGETGGEA